MRVIGGLLLAVLSLAGCDGAGAEGEDALAYARIEIRLQAEERALVFADVRGTGGLDSGAMLDADTLKVEPGVTYEAVVRLFDEDDLDVTGTVSQEAENHQFFYSLLDTEGVGLVVTDLESQYSGNAFGADLPVGLAFRLSVGAAAPREVGSLRVRLGHFPSQRKNGSTLTVTPVVDVVMPLRVALPPDVSPVYGPAGPPEIITHAEMLFTREETGEEWTVQATHPDSLQLHDGLIEYTFQYCTHPEPGVTQCEDQDRLYLRDGVYVGEWTVFGVDGQSLTEEIIDEGDWHRFLFNINFGPSPFEWLDADTNDLPIGRLFRMTIPSNIGVVGTWRVRLAHYNPEIGEVKNAPGVPDRLDMEIRFPMTIDR